MSSNIPVGASTAVFHASELMPATALSVQGPNFDTRISLETLLASYERIGFQANSLGKAIDIVNRMVIMLPSGNIEAAYDFIAA